MRVFGFRVQGLGKGFGKGVQGSGYCRSWNMYQYGCLTFMMYCQVYPTLDLGKQAFFLGV